MGTLRTMATPKPYIAYTEVLALSADDSAVNFDSRMTGGYLTQVEIFASADDAMTFTINSALGTELFTTTTTGATSGEIATPTAFYYIPKDRVPNWTLSGLGSGTVTIEVTMIMQ